MSRFIGADHFGEVNDVIEVPPTLAGFITWFSGVRVVHPAPLGVRQLYFIKTREAG
jgi:hypothetical protein